MSTSPSPDSFNGVAFGYGQRLLGGEITGDSNSFYAGRIYGDYAAMSFGEFTIKTGAVGNIMSYSFGDTLTAETVSTASTGLMGYGAVAMTVGTNNLAEDVNQLRLNASKTENATPAGQSKEIYKTNDQTANGRTFTEHGAARANERGFTAKNIDDIVDNYKKKDSKVDKSGRKTWEYTDNRGNKVVLNEQGGIVSVHSPTPDGDYIPKPNPKK